MKNIYSHTFSTFIIATFILLGSFSVSAQNVFFRDVGTERGEVIAFLQKYEGMDIAWAEVNQLTASMGDLQLNYYFNDAGLVRTELVKIYSNRRQARAGFNSHLIWMELLRALPVKLDDAGYDDCRIGYTDDLTLRLTLNEKDRNHTELTLVTSKPGYFSAESVQPEILALEGQPIVE